MSGGAGEAAQLKFPLGSSLERMCGLPSARLARGSLAICLCPAAAAAAVPPSNTTGVGIQLAWGGIG